MTAHGLGKEMKLFKTFWRKPPHDFKPGDVVLTKRGYGYAVGNLFEPNIPEGEKQIVSKVYDLDGKTRIVLDKWPVFSFRPGLLTFVERGPAPKEASTECFLSQARDFLTQNKESE